MNPTTPVPAPSFEPFPGSRALDESGRRQLPDETAQQLARSFDLVRYPAGFIADPYPVFQALLSHAPVHRMPSGSVLVTRHADLEAIYKDTATFSSDKKIEFLPKFGAASPLYQHHTTSLVFNDPPLHTRVRKIMAGALTPRAVAAMEQPIVALVDRLLDQLPGKGGVDLISDFAAAIPVEVIGNMLGVPIEDREPLRDWSLDILGALEPAPTDEMFERGNRAVTDFTHYLTGLIADRRKRPGDPDKDVLTRLIQGEADGGRLSETELLQNCIFILNAGHETTTNLIGNALVTLTEWTGEREKLVAQPDMIGSAVEEFLRFESPVQLGNRRVTREVEIDGQTLVEGTSLTLCIGASGRDPGRFPRPDVLDIGRTPNRHLAFASGPHMCVGVAVARLEGRIAISRFLARFPHYHLSAPPVRGGRARFRGFLSVPATLG
jgi:cytochrome P450